MAKRNRRGKSTPRRRPKQGISIIKSAEALALANVATQTLFNVNPVEFVIGNQKGATAQGLTAISLKELFNAKQTGSIGTMAGSIGGVGATTTSVIMNNLKANAVSGVLGMVLVPAGFRVGRQLAKPAINSINGVLRQLKLSSTVRL